jgi:hypothetical protein
MAYEIPVLVLSFQSAADLSAAANQFKFVELDSSGYVDVCNAATDKPVGVLLNRPALGATAEVGVLGVFKVQGDADLAKGDLIGTSSDGQADAKTPGSDTTEYVVGRVLEDNSAAGGLVTATINCLNPHRAA